VNDEGPALGCGDVASPALDHGPVVVGVHHAEPVTSPSSRRLRGYDAVHLAAAERIGDATTVLVAGDRRLCDAALALGLQVSQLTAP
jgi:hypothetical protein